MLWFKRSRGCAKRRAVALLEFYLWGCRSVRAADAAANNRVAPRKILPILSLLFLLSACGFTPVYGTRENSVTVERHLSEVEVGLVADRAGQYLRNALLDRLRSDSNSADLRYFLRVYDLKTEDIGTGVRRDASTTRGEITTTITVELIDKTTGNPVLTRNLHATAGYNRLDNLYATLVSREATEDRLLDELADRIQTELSLYFSRAQ